MITFMFLLMLAQEDRIGGSIDASHVVAIPGNVHMNARPQFDEGPVDPAMKLNYVTLTLKLSDSQQKELINYFSTSRIRHRHISANG